MPPRPSHSSPSLPSTAVSVRHWPATPARAHDQTRKRISEPASLERSRSHGVSVGLVGDVEGGRLPRADEAGLGAADLAVVAAVARRRIGEVDHCHAARSRRPRHLPGGWAKRRVRTAVLCGADDGRLADGRHELLVVRDRPEALAAVGASRDPAAHRGRVLVAHVRDDRSVQILDELSPEIGCFAG